MFSIDVIKLEKAIEVGVGEGVIEKYYEACVNLIAYARVKICAFRNLNK